MPPFKRYYNVPSSVSRDLDPGDASWSSVIFQSGRPILDAELNLPQDASDYNRAVVSSRTVPSGFVRTQGTKESFAEYGFDPSLVNGFTLRRNLALVAGMPVSVAFTGTTNPGLNVVTLPAASASSGSPPDVKRTDFVFLEVWRAQVAPSPRAFGYVEIANSPQTISDGDAIIIGTGALGGPTVAFTARTVPAASSDFLIGANADATAAAFSAVVNNPTNALFPHYVTANSHGSSIVTVTGGRGGLVGNGVTLARSVSVSGAVVLITGSTLINGDDRPNKPAQDSIYRLGNVDCASATYLPDDLVDPVLNVESTQRVQVQYRIRAFSDASGSGINPKTQPDGFSNALIQAQGTNGSPLVANYPFLPADGSSASFNSDASAYGFVDNGLYIAGDGSSGSAADLGTVDGFVYAIPLCFVFRRNDASATGGFDPINNANGALSSSHGGFSNTHISTAPVAITAAASDRPDGLFHDSIVDSDILDLRRHVAPSGFDFVSELRYQTDALLGAKNRTWQADASDLGTIGTGSGGLSTTPVVCDEIARTSSAAGNQIRTFDHIARRFASHSVVEKIVFEIRPNAGSYPSGFSVTNSGTGWCEGDTVALDFSALQASSLQSWLSPAAATTVAGNWPAGTRVTDILTAYHDDGHSTVPVDQKIQFSSVLGIGTPSVRFTLDRNNQTTNLGGSGTVLVAVASGTTGSRRRLFLELEVTYPTGAGLTRTPLAPLVPSPSSGYLPYEGGSITQVDPSQRPPEMNSSWVPNPRFRPPFREVLLDQKSSPSGVVVTDTVVTRDARTVYPPRRVQTTVGLTANGSPAASVTVGSSERRVDLAAPVWTTGQVPVVVAYHAQDPIPDAGGAGYRVGVYYSTEAPQTAGAQSGSVPTNLLPEGLVLEPLATSGSLWTAQAGAGSPDVSSPFPNPMDVIPTPNVGMGFPKEWYFAASSSISVSGFNAETGSLTLPALVPVDGSAPLVLGSSGAGRGTATDAESRVFYDYANHLGYKPTVVSTPLSGSTRHKSFTAMLARVSSGTLLFRSGEIVLVVFSRFSALDPDNRVEMKDPISGVPTTIAAVYRTKNILLTAGN